MENKTQVKYPESDIVQIKAINEDSYWSKEYGIPKEYIESDQFDTAIYDLIVESHIKTQNSGK